VGDYKIIKKEDKSFPKKLKQIQDCPDKLYVKGNLKDNLNLSLAIVGTRKNSKYGEKITKFFTKHLVNYGFTIISGLALGIDGIAHRQTLNFKGKTIAVLGSGLKNIYPKKHKKLAKDILKNKGALITEYSPNTGPKKKHFPARNRIVAGLSLGVLVVEAPKRSGALITARYGVNQGKEVFVIPGRITDKNSIGANSLIKKGAHLVTHPQEIIEILGLKIQKSI